jgi:hypothetical protein
VTVAPLPLVSTYQRARVTISFAVPVTGGASSPGSTGVDDVTGGVPGAGGAPPEFVPAPEPQLAGTVPADSGQPSDTHSATRAAWLAFSDKPELRGGIDPPATTDPIRPQAEAAVE